MNRRNLSYNNKLINHFDEHASIYLFTIVLFSIGVTFGAIVVNSLSFTQKEDLFFYLNEFFGAILANDVTSNKQLFLQSLSHNSKFIALIWILGISIIGLPLILIFLFLKGIVVGFTVGFLVNQMGWNGFLLSFVAILPQNLIIIPVFIVCATMSVTFSLQMIRKQFTKTTNRRIGPLFTNYIYTLLLLCLFLIAAAAVESYVSPYLMKIVLSLINK